MRTSNRDKVINAALRVIERDGVAALSYESVAAESGLTKGGVLYHFASREELLEALHERFAEQWETELVGALGGPVQDASREERLHAYIQTSVHSPARAELLLLLEAGPGSSLDSRTMQILDTWAPDLPENLHDIGALSRFVARLAADGLWLYEGLSRTRIPPVTRTRIAAAISTCINLDDGRTIPARSGQEDGTRSGS